MPLAVTKHSYDLTKKLGCLDKEANGGLECLRNKKAEEFVPIPEVLDLYSRPKMTKNATVMTIAALRILISSVWILVHASMLNGILRFCLQRLSTF